MLDAAGFIRISDAEGVGVGVLVGRTGEVPPADAPPLQARSRTPLAATSILPAVRTPLIPQSTVAEDTVTVPPDASRTGRRLRWIEVALCSATRSAPAARPPPDGLR